MNEFKLENQSLYYRVSGRGNPVLFLHGFLENHTMWEHIITEFEQEKIQCIVVDLPCQGESRFAGENCSMPQMAALLNAFLIEKRIVPTHVIGHSMGGYVGLELLKLRTFKLALLHSNFWADAARKKQDRNRVVEIVRENKMKLIQEAIPKLFAAENRPSLKAVIEHLMRDASAIPSHEIIASTLGMRDRLDNTDLLQTHEITIIHGEKDTVVTSSELKKHLTRSNATPNIVVIPNCGHMSIWESPHKLINHLKTFIFK